MWLAAFAALFTVLLTTPLTVQAAVVGAFEVTGGDENVDYSYDTDKKVLTIKTATALTIKNTNSETATEDRIQVEAGVSANITLAGVKIELGTGSETEYENLAAFEILPDTEGNGSTGNVTITVADGTENTLKSGWNRAGIEKSGRVSNTLGTLTIKGGTNRTGYLLAQGGADAPGIGSQNGTAKITIENVILTANAGEGGSADKMLNGIGDSCGGENSAKLVVRGGSVFATPVNTSNALGGKGADWPTVGKEYISLLAIYNPDGKEVWIDGEKYYPSRHADGDYLYAYLSHKGHSVRVGDEAEQVYYYSRSSSFKQADQFSISANDKKALVYGTDYTYEKDRLMVLTNRAVTISNCDSTAYTEHTLGVGKDVNADITLAGVKIQAQYGAAFFIEDDSAGDVTLRIAGNTENYLEGWHGSEGICKTSDLLEKEPEEVGTLTITGTGSLVVEGGTSGSLSRCAGIGSEMDLANIVIDVAGVLKINGHDAPGIGSYSTESEDDYIDYITRNVVIRGGGTVSVVGGYGAPAIMTEDLQLNGGSIYLEAGVGFEGKAVENAEGNAVIPTNGEGEPVYLLAVDNEDSLPVYIDGVSQVPVNHKKILSDTGLYVYLPEGMHTVKIGDTEYKFFCDAASNLAYPLGSGMQITADDGSTLDYGVDYTYGYYSFPTPNLWPYNYFVLRILTAKPVTIRNTDPETPLMEQIQVAKDVSANITLDGVSLVMMMNAPFEIEAGSTGNVCLTIADDSTNSLVFEPYILSSAGIQKNDGTAEQPGTLTIQGGAKGNGLLTVTGGGVSAGIGAGIVGTENLAALLAETGLPESTGTSNIIILGGNIVTSGATGIGSPSGTAKNIQILGGTVTTTAVAQTTEETEIKASAISGISKASDLVIGGGSVKAVPANGIAFGKGETAVTPVDRDGNAVYLLELENAAGTTLKVDGVSYPVKHGEEAKLYLYLPAKTVQTPNRVTLGSVTTGYIYDEVNGKWLRVGDNPAGSEEPGSEAPGSADPGDEEEDEEDDGDNGSAGTFIPSQEAALAGNEISISTESGWSAVNELLGGLSQISGGSQTSGENRNINLYAKGVSRIPGNVLQTLSGTKLTLAVQHRNGVALSVSGSALNSRNISRIQMLDLTVDTDTRNIPWEVIREKHVSVYRQLTVKDTGRFAVPVNLHVNVGAGNAGRYANFYRYNEVLGRLVYCGSFRVTENGQAMTALQQGGNYLVTVTDTIPTERYGR